MYTSLGEKMPPDLNHRLPRIPENPDRFSLDRLSICCICGQSCFHIVDGKEVAVGRFMVKDAVWDVEANIEDLAGGIHAQCLQERIGRQLQPEDFIDCLLTEIGIGEDRSLWIGPPFPATQPIVPVDHYGPYCHYENGKVANHVWVSAFDSPTGYTDLDVDKCRALYNSETTC